MRLTILQKYLCAFLGLTLIVLTASLGLARWSFERGFLEYVNTLEQQRLELASNVFSEEYVRAGDSWSDITPARMHQLLSNASPEAVDRIPRSTRRPPPVGRPPPPGRRLPVPGGPRLPPITLYDLNNERVIGPELPGSNASLHRVPIVADGETVGELRSAVRDQLVSPQEAAFSTQQLNASWIIGAGAMVLALAISMLLARSMLLPIRRMHDDLDRLSKGEYSMRMSSNRKDELGDLMNNLDRLAVTLDESREARQRWFADVSHELRTPVTVLSGELEAMQDGIRECNRDQVESLMQEVQRLRYLIDDLYELSVSDIGGLRYEMRPVSLHASLCSIVDGVRIRASKRNIQVELESGPAWIDGDPNRIDQLFHNLLANSLDYTDAPGKLVVSLSTRESKVIVLIEDTPPGVPAAACEQLFEPLYRRESSRSRRTGGAGLGLAICRKVVEAHGGTITASPSHLGGLKVRIELPEARDHE